MDLARHGNSSFNREEYTMVAFAKDAKLMPKRVKGITMFVKDSLPKPPIKVVFYCPKDKAKLSNKGNVKTEKKLPNRTIEATRVG